MSPPNRRRSPHRNQEGALWAGWSSCCCWVCYLHRHVGEAADPGASMLFLIPLKPLDSYSPVKLLLRALGSNAGCRVMGADHCSGIKKPAVKLPVCSMSWSSGILIRLLRQTKPFSRLSWRQAGRTYSRPSPHSPSRRCPSRDLWRPGWPGSPSAPPCRGSSPRSRRSPC